ncbi:hypothetical protein C1645_833858 [Glomus cerebriforme]|uniref:Uncharacterized protein n=1 Tax=Glomus cerebriforme TaxID=658196 RepID=A0A397SGT3_9GLOM|nr:hypothetical protein C1645_833858 [Glomus cerebriforme]
MYTNRIIFIYLFLIGYYNKAFETTHYIITILDSRWKIKYFQDWKYKKDNNNSYYRNAKRIFTCKFDEYCSLYYAASAIVNDNLEENEDLLFPVPKHFRNNNE